VTPAYDLVVVGGGSAGATAAIVAAEAGARVLLVEKTSALGGSSRYSAGNLWNVEGAPALDHLRALSFTTTPDDVLEAYLSGLQDLRAWLAEHGAATVDVGPDRLPHCWPNFPGAERVSHYAVPGATGGGPALWAALAAALAQSTADVRTGTALVDLVVDDSGVAGAKLSSATGDEEVTARNVILATGGFENAPDLLAAYLPLPQLTPVGASGSTGDGLLISQRHGAAVWHMSTFFGFWSFTAPDQPTAYPLLFLGRSYLIVDSDGRRFHAEAGHEAHDALRPVGEYLPRRANHPHLPAYAIFDEAMLEGVPLGVFPSPNDHQWSHDNSAELASGWITAGDTVGDLAGTLGLPLDALAASITAFNGSADARADPEFGRPAESMAALSRGRVYGIRIGPGVATTSGGPRRDARSRVLRPDGSVIPGLYAIGNTGSIWGHLTTHGGGLTDGLVFGAIAARDALERA